MPKTNGPTIDVSTPAMSAQDKAIMLYQLAQQHQQKNEFDLAIKFYQQAIKLHPCVAALYGLGVIYQQHNNLSDSNSLFFQALQLEPNNSDVLLALGLNHHLSGKFTLAKQLYNRVLVINPQCAISWLNLGVIAEREGDLPTAINSYTKATSGNDTEINTKAKFNLANTLKKSHQHQKASQLLHDIISQQPQHLSAHLNLANCYLNLHDFEQANYYYRQTLALNNSYIPAWLNLGHAGILQQDYSLAIYAYTQVLTLQPQHPEAIAHLYYCSRQSCDWNMLGKLEPILATQTKHSIITRQTLYELPLIHLARCDNLALNYRFLSTLTAQKYPTNKCYYPCYHKNNIKIAKNRKLNIGYLSADFYSHATMCLLKDVLLAHNQDKFNIELFDYSPPHQHSPLNLPTTKLHNCSDLQAAKMIYTKNIDILIDLKGYTQNHRLGICALRPAPIQINYLGFPATSGANFIDFIFGDKIVTPYSEQRYYSEKICHLPLGYQANSNFRVSTQLQHELYETNKNTVIYCSLNQAYKLDSQQFKVWLDILQAVEHSVLWLLITDKSTQIRLQIFAAKHNIDPVRLIFCYPCDYTQHIERLQLASIYLDTKTYNGHTTTSDALKACLPIVTQHGKHFASRVSASLLTSLNLQNWICNSTEEYKKLAISLGLNYNLRNHYREQIQKNLIKNNIFCGKKHAESLEQQFTQLTQNII